MADWKWEKIVLTQEQIQLAETQLKAIQLQLSNIKQLLEALLSDNRIAQKIGQWLLWVLNPLRGNSDVTLEERSIPQDLSQLNALLLLFRDGVKTLHIGEWNNGQATIHRLLWELAKNLGMETSEVPEWDWPVDSADMGIVGK